MKVKVSTSLTQSEFEEINLALTTRRGSECLIGRSPDSDLVLDSNDVSRLHGKFFSQGGSYFFCDVGSRNGTIVNGKLAEKDQPYQLRDGDIIRIGYFVLMLEDEILNTQQAETVVRIINPSVFSNWHQQNPSPAPQEVQPVNNELANSVPSDEISQAHEEPKIVNSSEEVEQSEVTVIQPEDIVTPDNAIPSPHSASTSDVELQSIAEVSTNESDSIVQAPDAVNVENDNIPPEHTIVQADDIANSEHETENILDVEHEEEIAPHTQDQEREISEAINSDRENLDLDTPYQQIEEDLVSENASILTPEPEKELVATSQEPEEVSSENIESEDIEESSIQLAKVVKEKPIVLVSHDSKKSELVELVTEQEEFLSYCSTRTWQNFTDDLYKQTGLSVTKEIPPANSGGYQAINSLVNSGEILAVIFLRDLMTGSQPGQASEEALVRICNINNVLLATNLPTAKAILYYLKNLKD